MGRTPAGQTRRKIYTFVRDRIIRGRPPTVREVQEAFGFRAVQSAREHLEALVSEGLLSKEPGRARGFGLPDASGYGPPARLVPLLGRVQAGQLTTALEEPDGYLATQSRLPEQELFALRVRGRSMSGAGILPGDIVIVRRQATAASGDTVVAMVGDEATVKTLKIKKKRIELHPQNPDFAVIVVADSEINILGKVVEVRRYLEDPKTG